MSQEKFNSCVKDKKHFCYCVECSNFGKEETPREKMLKELKKEGLEITKKGLKSFNKAYPIKKRKKGGENKNG